MAAWPASIIEPLHPSEYLVVKGAITETVLLPWFATYKSLLSGLKATSNPEPPQVSRPQRRLLPFILYGFTL
jgi:hypothetical protein